MCAVEINSGKVGGLYVNGRYRALPYTVQPGEKVIITQKRPTGFRYLVFGAEQGGYYMDANDPQNPRIEIAPAQEIRLGPFTLRGRVKR